LLQEALEPGSVDVWASRWTRAAGAGDQVGYILTEQQGRGLGARERGTDARVLIVDSDAMGRRPRAPGGAATLSCARARLVRVGRPGERRRLAPRRGGVSLYTNVDPLCLPRAHSSAPLLPIMVITSFRRCLGESKPWDLAGGLDAVLERRRTRPILAACRRCWQAQVA